MHIAFLVLFALLLTFNLSQIFIRLHEDEARATKEEAQPAGRWAARGEEREERGRRVEQQRPRRRRVQERGCSLHATRLL